MSEPDQWAGPPDGPEAIAAEIGAELSSGAISLAGPTKMWCTHNPSSRWSGFMPMALGTKDPLMASFSSAQRSLPSAIAGKRTAAVKGAEPAMGTAAATEPTARVSTGGLANAA